MRHRRRLKSDMKMPTGSSLSMSRKDQAVLLERFLFYAQADSVNWKEVNRDVEKLCAMSAPFDLEKMWREEPLTVSERVRTRWREGRLRFALPRRRVEHLLTQLKEALDYLYPKEFLAGPISVRQWHLPANVRRTLLQGRVAIRVDRKLKKVKSFVHFNKYYELDPPGLFWFAFTEILEGCGSLLRRCQECKKLFVKRKRQEVCSTTCRTNRWRRQHPEKARQIRRRAYERLVQRENPEWRRIRIKRRGQIIPEPS